MEPIYTAENCRFAYQLRWSLAVFWREAALPDTWLEALGPATEQDGVRILRHEQVEPNVGRFLLSTRPDVSPRGLVRSVKGRLQHAIRNARPQAFRRNFAVRSVGSVTRQAVEQYVAGQAAHHPMADRGVQRVFDGLQVTREVDLAAPRETAHARYWYNLHVVLVNEDRWRDVDQGRLERLRDMILRAAGSKGHLLSRAGIVADHVHLTVGCDLTEAPQDVVLGYMNNLAYVFDMRPVFRFSAYVATFGEYDVWVPQLRERL